MDEQKGQKILHLIFFRIFAWSGSHFLFILRFICLKGMELILVEPNVALSESSKAIC